MTDDLLIKAGALTSLAEARYFSSRMVDLVGFCFDPNSESYISPNEAQEIIKWLEGPKIVGEFGKQSPDEILDIASILNLDVLQLNDFSSGKELLKNDLPKIVKLHSAEPNGIKKTIGQLNPERDLVLIENEFPICKEALGAFPFFITVKTADLDLLETVESRGPRGINLEIKNSIEKIDSLLALLQ